MNNPYQDSYENLPAAWPSDAAFGRGLLAQIIPDVRKHVAGVKLRDAWVYHFGRDHWEFHYKDFYWHGDAGNAFEARYKGWNAYLAQLGVEGYSQEGAQSA